MDRILNNDTFNSPAEEQDSMKEAIMYDCNNKSNKKQVKERVSNMESELASSL